MQKQEFEERIERTVTDEQYKVIEEVYMWHPSIRNTSGKDEVAELYKSFGMTIFHDMLPRARGEMNTLYRDSIIQVLSTKIDNYRKTDILQPSDDMVLEQDKVIMAGDINVTVRNVVQSARGKE